MEEGIVVSSAKESQRECGSQVTQEQLLTEKQTTDRKEGVTHWTMSPTWNTRPKTSVLETNIPSLYRIQMLINMQEKADSSCYWFSPRRTPGKKLSGGYGEVFIL